MSLRTRSLMAVGAGIAVASVVLGITLIAGAVTNSADAASKSETIVGTSGDDQLDGTKRDDKIRAKGGDDVLSGRKGADKLNGGSGSDDVRGGAGNDKAKVKDGEADVVECGSGSADKVSGDTNIDLVSGCERGASQLANFASAVDLSIDGDYIRVQGNGIPDHGTGTFPGNGNPNSIQEQDYDYMLPLNPERAGSTTDTGGGAIGITVSGAVFYNPENAQGLDAVQLEVFDDCEGHPDQRGAYHYHQYSPCIYDDGEGHSEVWGYAFDGFTVHGPDSTGGEAPTDLDECNGHSHGKLGYHYHATAEYPYLIGCFAGEPTFSAGAPGAGAPLNAGLAAGMLVVPLVLLGGVAVLMRRRSPGL